MMSSINPVATLLCYFFYLLLLCAVCIVCCFVFWLMQDFVGSSHKQDLCVATTRGSVHVYIGLYMSACFATA